MPEKKELPETKKLSIEQEEKLSKIFKGYRTPRSGGGNFTKGDVVSGDSESGWFVEAKCTVKPAQSYSVSKAVLDKMEKERVAMRKPYATLAFQLGEDREDYFVLSTRTMKAILGQQEDLRNLIKSVEADVTKLDKVLEDLRAKHGTVSKEYMDLYTAHKQEKLAFINQLSRLI